MTRTLHSAHSRSKEGRHSRFNSDTFLIEPPSFILHPENEADETVKKNRDQNGLHISQAYAILETTSEIARDAFFNDFSSTFRAWLLRWSNNH